jgi:hypothetical protein
VKLRTFIICSLISGILPVAGCSTSKGADVAAEVNTSEVEASAAPTTSAGTQLTVNDATVLSRLLFLNGDLGGSTFRIDVPYGLTSSIVIEGEHDWKTHVGKGTAIVVGNDGVEVNRQELFWVNMYDPTKGYVLTTLAGLTEGMAAQGREGVKYVARPFSEQSPFDRLIRYVDGLSATQAENPLLLRQNAKTRSMGLETIEVGAQKIEATKMGFGQQTFWANPKNGRMLRAQAPLAGLERETIITLLDHGYKVIELPVGPDVVEASEIADLYRELTTKK